MFYEKIELGSTLRVIECPKCKNEEFGKDADFCRICGSIYIINAKANGMTEMNM